MTTTQTKERPILFSGPMVRAILEGQKTQTRRVVTRRPWSPTFKGVRADGKWVWGDTDIKCPYGQPADRLWVRETWADTRETTLKGPVQYLADDPAEVGPEVDPSLRQALALDGVRVRPSIHMPRWASRITLEVTGVRVERVQEITTEDCRAEGIVEGDGYFDGSPRDEFFSLWNKLNYKRGFGWDKNPWVWVIEFRRIK